MTAVSKDCEGSWRWMRECQTTRARSQAKQRSRLRSACETGQSRAPSLAPSRARIVLDVQDPTVFQTGLFESVAKCHPARTEVVGVGDNLQATEAKQLERNLARQRHGARRNSTNS